MLPRSVLALVVDDETLTRHLGDAEAHSLVVWLADKAEVLAEVTPPAELPDAVRKLCRRGRAMAHFVKLYCHDGLPGAAYQFAASEGHEWPLPGGPIDPYVLLHRLIRHESAER